MTKLTKTVPEKLRLGQFFTHQHTGVKYKLERVHNAVYLCRCMETCELFQFSKTELRDAGYQYYK